MGKSKARKTRWRALPIAGEQLSDSEGSNTSSAPSSTHKPPIFHHHHHHHRNSYNYHHHKSQYNFTYSSQSTPRRRYHDITSKSTRSSSTASENKITFNEDEYTKITTPRQDVLFKKGYLNKPKTYQTQTSTGTSITSTGNSTGNGTPDHQSTDLEYESQFVFPNGYVDQNGFYYVNGYEPYPYVFFNPPYYPEFQDVKSKRYSTDSMTESVSPNNEEATSQSGGEISNISDYNNPVYNMIYPGYYVNCPSSQDAENMKKTKRRRRRRSEKSATVTAEDDETSEYNTDENDSDEVFSDEKQNCSEDNQITSNSIQESESNETETAAKDNKIENPCEKSNDEEQKPEETKKYDLKPDAEEFVPRAFRQESYMGGIQFIKLPANFVPVPINHYGHPAFIPPPIPVNIIPQDPKLFENPDPNYFVADEVPKNETENSNAEKVEDAVVVSENENKSETESKMVTEDKPEVNQVPSKIVKEEPQKLNRIDIAKIVSKLEEAAKEQRAKEVINTEELSPKRIDHNQTFNRQNRYRNGFKRNFTKLNGGFVVKYNHDRTESPILNSKSIKESNDNSPHINKNSSLRSTPEKYRTRNWKSNYSPRRSQSYNKNKSGFYNRQLEDDKESQKHDDYKKHNYSEMVKKTAGSSGFSNVSVTTPSKEINENLDTPKKNKEIELVTAQDNKPQKEKLVNSQWIPVSRKKRKNQKFEEDIKENENIIKPDPIEVIENTNIDDEFESYDVNQLVDVIPKDKIEDSKEEVITVIQVAEKIEIISSDVPEEIVKVESINHIIKEEINLDNLDKLTTEDQDSTIESESKIKKKRSKKGTHKPTTKRVIITDVDLSPLSLKEISDNNNDNDKQNANNTAKAIQPTCNNNDNKKTENAIQVVTKSDSVTIETKSSSSTSEHSSSEKKSKNKKKNKKSKSLIDPQVDTLSKLETTSVPNVPNVANVPNVSKVPNSEDFCYDALLENSLLEESDDKTNIEVSQELDKIIQKGMYSNLEEKMKSLNVDMSDGFFQTILTNISSSRESSVEKTGFIKTPDFTKLLNSKHLFKSSAGAVSVEDKLCKNISDISKAKLPDLDLPSTSKAGSFLESPQVNEILLNDYTNNDQKIDELDTNDLSKSQEIVEENKEIEEVKIERDFKTLYPVTQAVKEWMSKTRETTPEVEILKSPSVIYQEFYGHGNEDEEVDGNSDNEDEEKRVLVNSPSTNSVDSGLGVAPPSAQKLTTLSFNSVNDLEEVTLFSTHQRKSMDEDILDYWDNSDLVEKAEKCVNDECVCDKCKKLEIDNGVEVYDSKYGRNEDYLKLQKEVNEKNNFPRQLPHQAVCCSVM